MWHNYLMRWLLRSPLHAVIGRSFMLITYGGRKSGKMYETPVNYVRDGDVLTVISFRRRTWRRNLRGGAPVTLHLQGRDLKATGQVVEDDQGIVASLLAYLQMAPQFAKYLHVSLDSSGKPHCEELTRAARDRVVVRFKLAA